MIDKNQIINNFNDIGKVPFTEREVEKLLSEGKEYEPIGKELIIRVFDLAYTKGIARRCLKTYELSTQAFNVYLNNGIKYTTNTMSNVQTVDNPLGMNLKLFKDTFSVFSEIEDETITDGINKHAYKLAKEIIRIEDCNFTQTLIRYCNARIFYGDLFNDFQLFLKSDIINKAINAMEIPKDRHIKLLFNSVDLSENAESIYKGKGIEKYTDTEMQITNIFCIINEYIILGTPYIPRQNMFILNAPETTGTMVVDKEIKLFGGDALEEIRLEDNFGMLMYNSKAATKFVW